MDNLNSPNPNPKDDILYDASPEKNQKKNDPKLEELLTSVGDFLDNRFDEIDEEINEEIDEKIDEKLDRNSELPLQSAPLKGTSIIPDGVKEARKTKTPIAPRAYEEKIQDIVKRAQAIYAKDTASLSDAEKAVDVANLRNALEDATLLHVVDEMEVFGVPRDQAELLAKQLIPTLSTVFTSPDQLTPEYVTQVFSKIYDKLETRAKEEDAYALATTYFGFQKTAFVQKFHNFITEHSHEKVLLSSTKFLGANVAKKAFTFGTFTGSTATSYMFFQSILEGIDNSFAQGYFSKHPNTELFLGLGAALTMSQIIFTFKNNIFDAVEHAEATTTHADEKKRKKLIRNKGVKKAFRDHRTFMLFGTLVTLVSIYTNFLGANVFLQQGQEREEQLNAILKKIEEKIGKPGDVPSQGTTPSTIQETVSLVQSLKQDLTNQGSLILEREDQGQGKSGVSGQGPSYKAKQAILFGSALPQGNSSYTQNILNALTKTPYAKEGVISKVDSVAQKHLSSISQAYSEVLTLKNALTQETPSAAVSEAVAKEVKTTDLSSIHAYLLNQNIKKIATLIDSMSTTLGQLQTEINQELGNGDQALRAVDLAAGAGKNNNNPIAKLAITLPTLDTSDIARGITVVEVRQPHELAQYLVEKQGMYLGLLILSLLLVLAALNDLADLLMMKKRIDSVHHDRTSLAILNPKLEAKITTLKGSIYDFLTNPENIGVFGHTTPIAPQDIHYIVENIQAILNPDLIPNHNKTLLQKLRSKAQGVLKSIFSFKRTEQMDVYNTRAKTLNTLLDPALSANTILKELIPGIELIGKKTEQPVGIFTAFANRNQKDGRILKGKVKGKTSKDKIHGEIAAYQEEASEIGPLSSDGGIRAEDIGRRDNTI